MKKLLSFLLLAIATGANAQSFKPDSDFKSSWKDEPAYLIDTIAQSSHNKQQLYSSALNYLNKYFNDSRAVIIMKDADLGEVAFKGSLATNYTDGKEINSTLSFKCHIYAKDNKFKVVLSALETPMVYFMPDVKATLRKDDYKPYNAAAKAEAINFIKNITEFLNRKPESDF